uniref:SGNH hydrolase-type esterase domain-containing protein n=1 Tax=Noctiluca scintillans TaxID=2966 RepID=A0A7S1F3C1_NOCSC
MHVKGVPPARGCKSHIAFRHTYHDLKDASAPPVVPLTARMAAPMQRKHIRRTLRSLTSRGACVVPGRSLRRGRRDDHVACAMMTPRKPPCNHVFRHPMTINPPLEVSSHRPNRRHSTSPMRRRRSLNHVDSPDKSEGEVVQKCAPFFGAVVSLVEVPSPPRAGPRMSPLDLQVPLGQSSPFDGPVEPQNQGLGAPSVEMSAVAPIVTAALQLTPSPEMDSALPETLKRPKSGEPQRRSPSLDMPRASRRSAVRRSPSLEMPRTTRSAVLRPREVPPPRGAVLRASSPERFALVPRGALLRSASPERVCTMQGPEDNVKALCDCSAILCLGDSLTAGYIDGIAPNVPYTDRFAQRLRKMGGSPVITNAGIRGEKSSQMSQRLAGLLHQGLKYDAVVIMAGTNDVLHLLPPDETFTSVAGLHKTVWDAGLMSVVMSIPPVRLAGSTQLALLEEYRRELNTRLQQLAASNPHRAVFVDVSAAVPLCNSALWSSDGVHLTQKGYEAIGEFVAEA